ncbi:MAG: RC-LH1 core complex protein PufX [Pseudomonadota bacterium]
MTDNHDYLTGGQSTRARLTADVTMLMLKGGGYAMVFCLAVWFTLWGIAAVGRLLPDEAREAQDPTPWSSVVPAAETVQST